MYIKIQTSPLSGGNTGSCSQLVHYLEKENLGKELSEHRLFFSHEQEEIRYNEVIEMIDKNGKGGIKKTEAKFYSIVLAPSQEELEHIGNDEHKLQEYTREAMQVYAENFNKGLNSQDIVWYAKIEDSRTYKDDIDIPINKKKGDEKEGLQTHIHVIVSRKDITKKMMLSPLANERGEEIEIGGKKIVKGFDRNNYKFACEKLFDNKFAYPRRTDETYEYFKVMSKKDSSAKEILLNRIRQEQEAKDLLHMQQNKEQQEKSKIEQQSNLEKVNKKVLDDVQKEKEFIKKQQEKKNKKRNNQNNNQTE